MIARHVMRIKSCIYESATEFPPKPIPESAKTKRKTKLDMTAKFGRITHNNGHFAFRGHSRPPILVPIESSYTASYIN